MPQAYDQYHASGRVNAWPFAVWAAITLLFSGGLAFGLFLLYRASFYFVGLDPLLLAGALSGLAFLAVSKGRCRGRADYGCLGHDESLRGRGCSIRREEAARASPHSILSAMDLRARSEPAPRGDLVVPHAGDPAVPAGWSPRRRQRCIVLGSEQGGC